MSVAEWTDTYGIHHSMIHSMQVWTVSMRNGFTRKRSSERLMHTGSLLRKNLQLKNAC